MRHVVNLRESVRVRLTEAGMNRIDGWFREQGMLPIPSPGGVLDVPLEFLFAAFGGGGLRAAEGMFRDNDVELL